MDVENLPEPFDVYDSDTATPEERQDYYDKCKEFWNRFNDALDEEDKLVPENGTVPSYDEATGLVDAMKEPHRRKLLWIATAGFTWPQYPNDDAIFRAEDEEGLGFETRIRDDDEPEYVPDMPDENMPSNNFLRLTEDYENPQVVNDYLSMISYNPDGTPVNEEEHDL